MPESVEAARDAAWSEFKAEIEADYSYPLPFGFEQTWVRAWDAGRASERDRIANPSPELVEVVASAMCAISPLRQWRTDRSWDATGESVRDSYRVLARAALQAAGSA